MELSLVRWLHLTETIKNRCLHRLKHRLRWVEEIFVYCQNNIIVNDTVVYIGFYWSYNVKLCSPMLLIKHLIWLSVLLVFLLSYPLKQSLWEQGKLNSRYHARLDRWLETWTRSTMTTASNLVRLRSRWWANHVILEFDWLPPLLELFPLVILFFLPKPYFPVCIGGDQQRAIIIPSHIVHPFRYVAS